MKKDNNWLSIAFIWLKFIVGSYLLGLVIFVLVRDIGAMLKENTYETWELIFICWVTGAIVLAMHDAYKKDILNKKNKDNTDQ